MSIMSGSRCLAEMLQGYGLSTVFLVPAVALPAVAEMDVMGMQTVMAHSELAAAYMADGYARARCGPGVCLAQAVGAANLAAGLRDAYLAHTPIVAITGGPEPATRYRGLYQEIEDLPMFGPVTKLNLRVERVERLPDLLRQAFREAASGLPGPTHLEIPGRVGQLLMDEAEMEPWVEPRFAHLPPYRIEPEAEAIVAVARALAEAERPVIVAGGGVTWSGGGPELVQLAEALSIPVATSLNAKHLIPDQHPLALGIAGTYGRWATNQAIAEADTVFFVGSSVGGHVTDNWRLPCATSRVLQADSHPAQIGRNCPADIAILGDARLTLARLLEAAPRGAPRDEWLSRVQELQRQWWEQIASQAHSQAAPIRPERLCHELSAWLPGDAVVVADTGHTAIWTGGMLRLASSEQTFIRCAGTLGWALPGAIGVKCALPQRPVICVTGDGGAYYHMAELETAARLGIPVIVVVVNNRCLRQTRGGWDAAFGSQSERARPLWVFERTDFAQIARSLGCKGLRVDQPGDLRNALDEALVSGRPALVDVTSDIEAAPPRPWPEA